MLTQCRSVLTNSNSKRITVDENYSQLINVGAAHIKESIMVMNSSSLFIVYLLVNSLHVVYLLCLLEGEIKPYFLPGLLI